MAERKSPAAKGKTSAEAGTKTAAEKTESRQIVADKKKEILEKPEKKVPGEVRRKQEVLEKPEKKVPAEVPQMPEKKAAAEKPEKKDAVEEPEKKAAAKEDEKPVKKAAAKTTKKKALMVTMQLKQLQFQNKNFQLFLSYYLLLSSHLYA